ncbi:MAG: FG-GAP-like repeat-containing protein [Candidatus Kapabacteria bacterium]|nr:FG-GAP-like repeat-containing protein [Candidatus Kapabacteria bacterium]
MKNLALALSISLTTLLLGAPSAVARIDTVGRDNGLPGSTNTSRDQWEESVILGPGRPCILKKILVYYGSGKGADEIRITGDASEGTIPPTQYCFPYNTLAAVTVNVVAAGWLEIDVSAHGLIIGGYDRIVVQHLMRTGGPVWSQDNNSQTEVTSYLYDPITPNPNFYNIPGIYYRSTGDYMVRLVVEDEYEFQPAPSLTDVSKAMGLVGDNGAAISADHASVIDWDNDGFDDVCVGSLYFHNERGERFSRASLPMSGGPTSWADVDNDGDMDCFVAAGNTNDKLWRNDGNGKFVDVTASSKITNDAPTVTALWFDLDQDGDLDLFLGNGRREVSGQETYFQDKLWRNDGGLIFSDVTTASGIAAGEPSPFYDTWGSSLCDFNDDGWTDIFVATYRLAPDRLYRNNKNGTFTEVSRQTGAIGIPTTQPDYFGHGMGSDWADIDNDGDVDLAVGNLGHPDSRAQYSNPSLILRNTGTNATPTFTNWYSTDAQGILRWHGVKFREMNSGMCFGDLDHDGSTDLWHGQISYEGYGTGANRPAHLYIGSTTPNTSFVDHAWESGMFIHGAWTAVRIDFDRDGDLDLLCSSGTESVKLFRNDMPKQGKCVTLRLRDLSGSHLDAYGAHAIVFAGGKQFHRWMPGTVSGGRMSQMSHDLHFGIGNAKIDSVVVRWPSGGKTRFTNATENSAWVVSSDGTAKLLTGSRALQVSPARGSVDNPASTTLRWTGPRGSKYDVRIGKEPTLTLPIVSVVSQTADTLLNINDTQGTTYFWQVRISGQTWSPVWDYTVGRPAALPVVPVTPRFQAINVPTTIAFAWRPAMFPGSLSLPTTFALELSRDYGFVDQVQRFTVTDTTLVVTGLSPYSHYYWRVRANSEWQNGTWSDTWQFVTYDVPGPVSLVFPENNANNVTIRPRFSWTRRPEVDKGYELEIDTSATFATALKRKASDTSYAIAPPLKPSKQYHWRIRGVNLAGPGRDSEVYVFTTSSTTSVEEDARRDNELTETIELYDVLGRQVASGPAAQRDMLLERTTGLVFCVERSRSGRVTAVARVTP